MKRLLFLSLILTLSSAIAEDWGLPLTVNPENTSVYYVVDSTWHTVHGTVKEPKGKIWQTNASNPLSISADLSFPLASFDSDNSSRDRKMHKVMHSDAFPEVKFVSASILPAACAPSRLRDGAECPAELRGRLTISGTTKEVLVPIMISKLYSAYLVKGELPIKWAEFGVEDPSILIAKLDPVVTVSFSVKISAN